ncbi:unnamed protein product [Urochloa decumbens]|uniref:DUF1618 domain-containing protein n=1 Tax=Urochloa decumbens TaxID=240449 RepID=A0ABC8Y7B9_9POAL
MFRDEGSFLDPVSLNPPALPAPNAAASSRRPGSPTRRVLLDTAAYVGGDHKNGTYAEATTRTGQVVGVSFWLADPPAVSHLCIHCPGVEKVTDLLFFEPVVVCSGKDIAVIRVSYNFGARPTETMEDLAMTDFDYFVYRAHSAEKLQPPSLQLLPNPKPLFFESREIGFLPLPCPDDNGEGFLIAVLQPGWEQLQYHLHIFSSKTNEWETKVLTLREPPSPRYSKRNGTLVYWIDKVIALDGGTLGWVDLKRGILQCNVLDDEPVLRYFKFPRPSAGNFSKSKYGQAPPWTFRDVTCSNGVVKLIEIEKRRRLVVAPAARPSLLNGKRKRAALDLEETTGTWCATESYALDGWAAVTWSRKIDSANWSRGVNAYVSGSSILAALRDNRGTGSLLALENLVVASPVWSVHGEDVFYMMVKADSKDKDAWAISVDVRKNTLLEEVASFATERDLVFMQRECQPFTLSKFPDTYQHVNPDN